jgi:ribonuclease D
MLEIMATTTITDTAALANFCSRLADSDYITLDTEFIRDKTFWPRLCLIQAANDDVAGIIDPLAEGIDLSPFLSLLQNKNLVKVFHAARQDVEIFVHMTGAVPTPTFDTQIAAMVCGFGDSVGYEKLVQSIARQTIDKASRFTDWARRPLNERQLKYALSDVTHLRAVYKWLKDEVERENRAGWLDEEMATLTDPETYRLDPDEAWRRLKSRGNGKEYRGILKEVAAWREREAQTRDLPRNRILKDEAIQELAAERPRDIAALSRLRSVPKGVAQGSIGKKILRAVEEGINLPNEKLPPVRRQGPSTKGLGPLLDLLKVLLKLRSEEHGVASKLIATVPDLEALALSDDADIAALHGWRREIFGNDALALKRGKLALAVNNNGLIVLPLGKGAPTD